MMTLALQRNGKTIEMEFWPDGEKDAGDLPDLFVGTVDDAGHITASPTDQSSRVFRDIYRVWCYRSWTIASGELSGLSQDGREVSGTIVETFRAVPQGQTFTIRSRFTATSPP